MDGETAITLKLEQPEEYVDLSGENKKIHPCLREQIQMEKKMVFGNIDGKLVKHELSDVLCEKKSHRFSKMAGMSSCSSQEMAGHINTESRIPEDISIAVHHPEVSLIGTNNTASQQHKDCSSMSENMSSVIEIKTKICLTNEDEQLCTVESPVKHTQAAEKLLHCTIGHTNCSPQKIQAGDTPHMSDADTFLQRNKTRDREEKPFKCDICGASFPQAYNLNCHVRTHTGEKPYKCDICTASFSQAGHLKRHMKTHTRVKSYKCNICAASFTQVDIRNSHMKIHAGEKPHKCHICGASFFKVGKLNTHLKIHTGVRPYKCDICLGSFTQADKLRRHMRTHTGEKPYRCDICDATFTQAGSLKCHLRTHTGDKPYKCSFCTAAFTQASHLKYHTRTHTGEKPYKCDICAVSFTQAGSLKCHKRTHTGEKPYKCDKCAACFTQLGNLQCHMRTHAGEKP